MHFFKHKLDYYKTRYPNSLFYSESNQLKLVNSSSAIYVDLFDSMSAPKKDLITVKPF